MRRADICFARRLQSRAIWTIALAILVPWAAHAQVPNCAQVTTADFAELVASEFDLPVYDHGVVTGHDLERVCFDRFCALFNNVTRTPLWVAEFMDENIAEKNFTRTEGKAGWNHREFDGSATIDAVDDDAYDSSAWSRGHMAASADFSCHTDWMGQTYTFSNAVPQWQNGFNSGVWSSLERYVKNLALSGDRAFVLTGPIYPPTGQSEIVIDKNDNACDNRIELQRQIAQAEICNANDDNPDYPCPDGEGVTVPAGLYKIVHLPDRDRTFAHILSNDSHTGRKTGSVTNKVYLQEWQVSINVIEELTGLDFFPSLDLRAARVKETQCTVQRFR